MGVYILSNDISRYLGKDYQNLINMLTQPTPREVNGLENQSAIFYRNLLLKKCFAIFEFTDLPEYWDYDYVVSTLFINGFVGISDTTSGIVGLECGLTGINIYNKPTTLVFANPVLGNFERTIHEDSEILHLNFDYSSVIPLVNKYAYQLAACDASIDMNLLNSRVAFVGEASTQGQAKTLEKLYTDISKGKPCVVFRNAGSEKGMNWYWNNVKQSFIADTILDCKARIIAEFLTEIGIKTSNMSKKERLVTDEVNSRNEEKDSAIWFWKKNLEEDCKKINKMFGLNIGVKVNNFDSERGGIDGNNSD